MGKNFGDFVSSLMERSSASTIQSSLLKDKLDQRLHHPKRPIAKDLISIARIAFACLNGDPKCRPTMEEVFNQLEMPKSSLLDQFDFHTVTLGQVQQSV